MRTHYHEFESFEHLLANRLLLGGNDKPIRLAVFGGTGAVGGASVMELCRLILQTPGPPLHGEIWATGLGDGEISKFIRRLYMALEDDFEIEELEPLRHYRLGGSIELRFSLLRLSIPTDLAEEVARRQVEEPNLELPSILNEVFSGLPCPFKDFVERLEAPLHAVIMAIPLPSVATYTLTSIDALVSSHGLDHATGQQVKKHYLETFIHGLAEIRQRHARRVLIAHTTAVGGMYRVDADGAEIRIGFAHSALGKKLFDKKYFADELTRLFLDRGFDVMVTAAAIGIDEVDADCHLPSDRAIQRRLRARSEEVEHEVIAPQDLSDERILLYPSRRVAFGEPEPAAQLEAEGRLSFGRGEELRVEAAIRSGENGLFSVANCVALYNVMKVAIPEELAMVLVRYALFGQERRRQWFHDGICYYTETENCHFALRMLECYPELVRAHHGAFAVQSYQALGSATHQARLHEQGLFLLMLRLRELRRVFGSISEYELAEGLDDLDVFLWRRTSIPAFQDLDGVEAESLGQDFGQLCETETAHDAARLLGCEIDPSARPERARFLAALAERIQRYAATITSLGVPILYRDGSGRDRMLIGPYVAPFDVAVADAGDLHDLWHRLADARGVDADDFRDWTVVNNGFVDLRPHALSSSAREAGADLENHLGRFETAEELAAWIANLKSGSYFTTGGLVAMLYRLSRLSRQVRRRKMQLGTRETWKHLFLQDRDGRHLLTPGMVETMRMYSEGLGKITGTEALWPRWGY
ncbi:MAG: hypothetical protein AAF725_07625 [Acidobacteriota bacterium]